MVQLVAGCHQIVTQHQIFIQIGGIIGQILALCRIIAGHQNIQGDHFIRIHFYFPFFRRPLQISLQAVGKLGDHTHAEGIRFRRLGGKFNGLLGQILLQFEIPDTQLPGNLRITFPQAEINGKIIFRTIDGFIIETIIPPFNQIIQIIFRRHLRFGKHAGSVYISGDVYLLFPFIFPVGFQLALDNGHPGNILDIIPEDIIKNFRILEQFLLGKGGYEITAFSVCPLHSYE